MEEELYGASSTDPRSIAGMGVLNSLSGGRGDLVQQYVNEAVPLPKKADPYVAALKFFIEMGKQASQPGATVLGSITGSMGAPVDYLEAKALERQKAEQARSALGLQIAPSLKAGVGKVTYRPATAAELAQYGATAGQMGSDGKFYDLSKTASTSGQITLGKYLDPSRIDDPETKTVNEQIIQLTAAEYQARMAAGNPVYPLSATDSALNKPDRAPIAKKTTFYKNGTTLAMFDTGPVLYKGGKVVAEEDFDTVNDEGLRSGILNTMSESAASEAGKSAIQIGTEAFVTMGKLQEEMKVLERAKELVLPEGGANTGWLASKLPSIWAASIELDNIQSKLGLAVVGQNTFGALSKGELDLALATALPKTMNEAELADWIDRKIIAQGKLIRHYSDAASYLTNPLNKGGIAAWVDIKREAFEAEQGAEAIAAAAVITNMSEEEFDAITSADKEAMTIAELQAYLARLQGQ
jgi:hypothetical protein